MSNIQQQVIQRVIQVPSALKYDLKNDGAMATSYTSNCAPQTGLGGYVGGSEIKIDIPIGTRKALCSSESYLKFSIVPTDISGVSRLDSCGAHGVIRRIRVYCGSDLLEELDSYGLFAKQMMDLQISADSAKGKYSVLAGTRSDSYTAGTVTKDVNSGALLTAGADNYFCITLLSLLGSLDCGKYFPLFACGTNLRLEITLVDNIYCFANSTGATDSSFKVNDVEYVASMLELSPEALNAIAPRSNSYNPFPNPFAYSSVAVSNYSSTAKFASSGTSIQNFDINAKNLSLKSIICCMRDTATMNTPLYYPYGAYKYGLSEYSFKIGTDVYPRKAPQNVQMYFSELLKSVNSLSNIGHQPAIDIDSYNVDKATSSTNASGVTAGSVQSGSFYVGLNCEAYPNADTSSFIAGMNTKASTVTLSFNNTYNANVSNARLDAFTIYDCILTFENGRVSRNV